jgi:hypothetical protein
MNLVQAEILKLRRRRALMLWTLLLTLGPVVVGYAALAGMHLSDPQHHGVAGGTANLEAVLGAMSGVGLIAAIIIGTTAGSQDVSSGVFRDLVLTGRSRTALFRARVAGALAVFAPFYLAAFALAVGASFALAGDAATASPHRIGQYTAWLLASMTLTIVLAVAAGSIVSSRIATGVLVVWNSAVAGLLAGMTSLGEARTAIGNAAAEHFLPPVEGVAKVPMSNATAVFVLAAWIGIALRAGALWTQRRDA